MANTARTINVANSNDDKHKRQRAPQSTGAYLQTGGNAEQVHGKNILDVQIPPEMYNAPTGIGWYDRAAGGDDTPGIVRSCVTLMTAVPGGGKSTLCMQLADSVTRQSGQALYNIGEESEFQVRRTAARMGIERGYAWSKFRLVDDVFNHAEKMRKPGQPVWLFLDSLKTLDDGFYKDGAINSMTAVRVMKKVIAYCKSTYSIAVIVGHVTKAGQFEGKQQLKHDCDAHVHIKWDTDKKSESYGKRILNYQKNRFGPISVNGKVLDMTTKGLFPAQGFEDGVEAGLED